MGSLDLAACIVPFSGVPFMRRSARRDPGPCAELTLVAVTTLLGACGAAPAPAATAPRCIFPAHGSVVGGSLPGEGPSLRVLADSAQVSIRDGVVTTEVTAPYRVSVTGALPMRVEARHPLHRFEGVLALAPGAPLVIESVSGSRATVFVPDPHFQTNRFEVECASLRAPLHDMRRSGWPREEPPELTIDHLGPSERALRVFPDSAGEEGRPIVVELPPESEHRADGNAAWNRVQVDLDPWLNVQGWARTECPIDVELEVQSSARVDHGPAMPERTWLLGDIAAGTRICVEDEGSRDCRDVFATRVPMPALMEPVEDGRCRLLYARTLLTTAPLFFRCERADTDRVRVPAYGLVLHPRRCGEGRCYAVARRRSWSVLPWCDHAGAGARLTFAAGPRGAADAAALLGAPGSLTFMSYRGEQQCRVPPAQP